ncbi:complement decay-accelerating factor isoform 1-T1 [Rhynchonycteris naso]
MSPAWTCAPAVVRRLGGLTFFLLLLLLCPLTVRGDCKPPPDVPNAKPGLEDRTSFPDKSIVTYKCEKSFVKVPGKPDSVICLKDKWTAIEEFCNRSCDFPTRLSFASLKNPYKKQNYFPLGSVVEYECRMGFNREHSLSENTTCLQNFTWSKADEFCKKKSCPKPGAIINGHVNITTDILFGAYIVFTCDAGYELVGATFSYCILVGENVDWSDPLPKCKESSPISKVIPTSQTSTTVNVPGTKTPSTPQRPETVHSPATRAPSTQKPTTANVPGTKTPSTPQSSETVHSPATRAPSTQKPTTVHILATGAPSTSQKLKTVHSEATRAPSTPQRPTPVDVPGTKAPSTQKPKTVNISATGVLSMLQKPSTVDIPATEATSTPQHSTTINFSATKAPLILQKPTLNFSAMETPPIPQKPIVANDSPESYSLSTETLPAAQTPIISNFSTQATPKPQRSTTAKTSLIQSHPVTQKFIAIHAPVTKDFHTAQRLTSAHITETQSPHTPMATTPFHTRSTSIGRGNTSSGHTFITLTVLLMMLVAIG